jgi:inositol-phosphate phosphatase / L-galactose 1-phosphate phosphatase / histidinol-phosphatase
MTLDDLLATALAVSEAARPVPLGYFRKPLEVIAKADESPVTIADRETERVMREVLAARVPEHGIFGEEHGRERLDHRFVWVLDPIDGTKSFITGMPLFNNLIALLDDGGPVLGVVDTPAIGERYHAARGRGAWFNGTAIRTSGCASLAAAAVYRAGHAPADPAMAARFDRFAGKGRVNRYGYDAYVYALLAAGHVDLMLETDLEPYDYLALVALIEEAGGVITDWSGQPLGLHSKGDVLAAASPALHAEALALLQRD